MGGGEDESDGLGSSPAVARSGSLTFALVMK